MIWLWNKFFLRLSVRCEDILSRRTQGWQISLGQTKWMLAHTWLKYATSWLPTVCVGDFFFFFFLGSRGSRDSSALHQSLRRAYVDLFLCINSLTPHKRPIYAQQATTSNRSCFAYRIMYLHRKVHACVCVCVCVCVIAEIHQHLCWDCKCTIGSFIRRSDRLHRQKLLPDLYDSYQYWQMHRDCLTNTK